MSEVLVWCLSGYREISDTVVEIPGTYTYRYDLLCILEAYKLLEPWSAVVDLPSKHFCKANSLCCARCSSSSWPCQVMFTCRLKTYARFGPLCSLRNHGHPNSQLW